jgi:hypothetical protein
LRRKGLFFVRFFTICTNIFSGKTNTNFFSARSKDETISCGGRIWGKEIVSPADRNRGFEVLKLVYKIKKEQAQNPFKTRE